MITRSAPTAKIWKQQDLDNGWSVEDGDFDPGDRSTIIAQHNYSPKHEADPGQMIPAFYRWSDIVWLAWTQIARDGASRLHYIIQENIITALTRKVMEIISGAGPDALNLPWPGRLYDLRSKEGKALLATPHGVGIAFLISDHSNVLGRKYPAVCIFTARNTAPFSDEAWNYYMIWELRDATEGGMELDQPRTYRDMV
ncbi:MAG: hypothetical protein LQ344_001072 [Seirophora lacunosa]|nr:MAG: hypothetical protein LQ344_001072 [Seirophora lacunosa]